MPWKNPAYKREYQRALNRRRLREGYLTPQNLLRLETVAQLLHAQGGRCYLCGDVATLGGRNHKSAVLEHDHRCCPNGRWCRYCLRGVSCADCNSVIGYAYEDPARLRVIADNLEAALSEVATRFAAKPQQMSL
jgi:hypothetical protein